MVVHSQRRPHFQGGHGFGVIPRPAFDRNQGLKNLWRQESSDSACFRLPVCSVLGTPYFVLSTPQSLVFPRLRPSR